MAKGNKKKSTNSALATNRRARHDYEVLETIEAGIELLGTEVKSLREGQCSMQEAFAGIVGTQMFLYQMSVEPYKFGNRFNHNKTRERRLLLHKSEIKKMAAQVNERGLTLIPLKIYLKDGRVKLLLGVCRGKHTYDKRETLKRKMAERDMSRAMRHSTHR